MALDRFDSLAQTITYYGVSDEKKRPCRRSAAVVACMAAIRQEPADLSRHFAQKKIDKFSGIPHTRTLKGVPVLEGVIGFIECKVHQVCPGGDHQMIVGNVCGIVATGGEPLVHFRGNYRQLL